MFSRRPLLASVVLASACVVSACATRMTGVLDANGYKHSTYGYQVQPIARTGALLPDGWVLDNLYDDGSQPGTPTKPKESSAYVTTYRFDTDGDGSSDGQEEAFVYDLRYQHRVHSGIIWLRSVPLSQTLRDKELRVLMQAYVDDVAGAGYEVVNLYPGEVAEKRFAAELLKREEGTFGGTPAFAAEFAVANVDQVRVTARARQRHVKVVIARPGFVYTFTPGTGAAGGKYPVLVVAGYASQPEDFARGLADFEGLLKRVAFNGKTGLALRVLEPPKDEVANPPEKTAEAPKADVAEPPGGEANAPKTDAAAPTSP